VTLALGFTPLSLYLAMSSFALQGGYGLSPQQFGYVFAVNSVGILAVGRVNLRLVTRLGPRRLLGCGLAISVTACATVCAAALTGAPLVAVLAPLFVAISCVGLLLPNGTTLAMSAQSAAVGSAAALLGLIQSVINAGLAPLISLLGVTPAVLGTSMLLSALAGVVPFLAIPRAAR
jgi:DHA1 family bicyclomycin/chloramphenicol resistance-like MFS transporter